MLWSFPISVLDSLCGGRKHLGGVEEIIIICDLCGKQKECLQKEMEGKEYDICSECWSALAQKLKGKGRNKHDCVPATAKNRRTG